MEEGRKKNCECGCRRDKQRARAGCAVHVPATTNALFLYAASGTSFASIMIILLIFLNRVSVLITPSFAKQPKG